ncbi:MAG: GNAT family N-acetyltransferase [Gammaproteobacteria bacterium]
MRTRICKDTGTIASADWNALLADSNPFLRHEFLHALETSGCAAADEGWQTQHILCEEDDGQLIGALPLYLKDNSQGEFVFDFSWASAYHQAGLRYYPKLVSAVPFTPATGNRLLLSPGLDEKTSNQTARKLIEAATDLAREYNASSLHILFPTVRDKELLVDNDLLIRKDCQFHWHNHGYADFDHFLEGFTSSKRKKTKRERRRIAENGIQFEVKTGHDMNEALWDELMPLYNTTFLRRGRMPYLNREFFLAITNTLPDNLVVFMGREGDELVAVAICFRSDDTLYGRYWGANRFIDSLHFETCYYQGIDFCIREKLRCFEPGTQGEHKISRGFVPTETWSAHWLSHPQFAVAIDDFLQRERGHIDSYMDVVNEHIPYKKAQD